MSGDVGGGGAPVCSMTEKSPRESPDEVVGPREEGGSPGRRGGSLRGWRESKQRVGIERREPL